MKRPFHLPYIPILYKLIVGLLIIVILPLGIAAQYLYNASLRSLNQEQSESSLRVLEMARQNVEYHLRDLDERQKKLYDNLTLMAILPTDSEQRLTDTEMYLVRNNLREYMRAPYLNLVCIFLDNGQVVSEFNGHVQYVEQYENWFHKQDDIRPTALYRDGRCIWRPTVSLRYFSEGGLKENIQQSFTVGRLFRNAGSRLEDIGYIMQGVDVSLFNEPLRDLALGNGQQMMITAPDGTIIWHSDPQYISQNFREIRQFSHVNVSGPNYDTYDIEGQSYLVTSTVSAYNDWQYSLLTPSEILMAGAEPLRIFSNLVWAMCAVVLVCGVLFYHKLVTRPLKRLIVDMNSLMPGSEPLRPRARIHNDEIGVLYDSFVSMQKRINLLLKQVTDSHDQQLRQEILTLQAQLNPHFLYNTLDTINWMADDIGAEEISRMIRSLAQIMRYTIGRGEVTVADELKMVKNYIAIQQYRFENRFRLECEVDEDVLGYGIDRLLIQPIVENAVNHGLADREGGGLIALTVWQEERELCVLVHDNGKGIEQETIQGILLGRADGIGLYNIHRFVRMKYGLQYGLQITSETGRGTTVRLRLPTPAKTWAEGPARKGEMASG